MITCDRLRLGNSSRLNFLEQYDQAEVFSTLVIDPALTELPGWGKYTLRIWPSIYLRRLEIWRTGGSGWCGWVPGEAWSSFPGLPALGIRLWGKFEW